MSLWLLAPRTQVGGQVSQQLSDSIESYLTYRRTAFTKGTYLASDQSLRQFLAVVGNIQTKSLMPRHAERFQSSLLSAGKKPATVNSRMSQVSKFSQWAVANRLCPAHFVGTVRTIPVPRKAKLRVPAHDFIRLLETADRPDRRMVIALGLFLFLRGGEIKTLRVGDVDLDMGIVNVVIHKTNDWDEMPVCQELDEELRRWFIAYAHDIGRPLHASDYLIPAHHRFPGWLPRPESGNYQPEKMVLRPFQHVQVILDKAGYPITEAGKKSGEGVHTLRRSGARALYDALVEGRIGDPSARDDALRQVMSMLHHSSISITEHYIGLERDRQRRDKTLRGTSFLPETSPNVVTLASIGSSPADLMKEAQ